MRLNSIPPIISLLTYLYPNLNATINFYSTLLLLVTQHNAMKTYNIGITIVLLAHIFLVCIPVTAQTNRWHEIHPSLTGNHIFDIAWADDNSHVVAVGGNGLILHSDDAGDTWGRTFRFSDNFCGVSKKRVSIVL